MEKLLPHNSERSEKLSVIKRHMKKWTGPIASFFYSEGNRYTCIICQYVTNKIDTARYHYRTKHDQGKHMNAEEKKERNDSKSGTAWHSLLSAEGTCSLCGFRQTLLGRNDIFQSFHIHLDSRHPEKLQEVITASLKRTEAEETLQLNSLPDNADNTVNQLRAENLNGRLSGEIQKIITSALESTSPRQTFFSAEGAWRSFFSTEGACTLCDYRPTRCVKDFNKFLQRHLQRDHRRELAKFIPTALKPSVKDVKKTNETVNRVDALSPKDDYVCASCDLSFSTEQERLRHLNDAHPIPSTSLTCSECGKVFSTMLERRKHRHNFLCRNCGARYLTEAARNSHMLRCQQPCDHFLCPLCGKSFDAERLLKAHLAMKHQPTQQDQLSNQVEALKEPGRKRLKLEEVDQSFIYSEANGANKSTVRGWDCVEPKQDSDSSDLSTLINFAIVKDEVDDGDSFEDSSDSKILPAKIKQEADADDLSEMTVSVVTCKEERDEL